MIYREIVILLCGKTDIFGIIYRFPRKKIGGYELSLEEKTKLYVKKNYSWMFGFVIFFFFGFVILKVE